MAVEVSTSEYQFSHGKMPRGTGHWGFEIAGEIYWTNGSYTVAKQDACRLAIARGVSRVKVCP